LNNLQNTLRRRNAVAGCFAVSLMETILAQYKGNKAEVIQALQDTQKAYGYISPENLKAISASLSVPYAYTYALATFYKSFALQERGRYVLKVCAGTACHLKLSEELVAEIKQHLGIEVGGTTKDKLFTLELVNCLGACAMAPAMAVNEKLYGQLTRKKVRELLDSLAAQPKESQRFMHKIRATIDKTIDKVIEGMRGERK
jgi:NADH:ubiquinone oxidoreductase subunit E